jgi:hypothetical protein
VPGSRVVGSAVSQQLTGPSGAIAAPVNVTAGNFLPVWCHVFNGGTATAPTITKSSGTATIGTPRLDASVALAAGTQLLTCLFMVPITGSGSLTLQFTGAGTDPATYGWDEITGLGSSPTKDVAWTNSGTGANYSTGAQALGAAAGYLAAGFAEGNSAGIIVYSAESDTVVFEQVDASKVTAAVQEKIVSGGTHTITMTVNNVGMAWHSLAVSYLDPAGGAATPSAGRRGLLFAGLRFGALRGIRAAPIPIGNYAARSAAVAMDTGAGDVTGIGAVTANGQLVGTGSSSGISSAAAGGQLQGAGAVAGIASTGAAGQEAGNGAVTGIGTVGGAGSEAGGGGVGGIGGAAGAGQGGGGGQVVGVGAVTADGHNDIVSDEGAGGVAGVSTVTATGQLQGAGAVAGISTVTADAAGASAPPISIMDGGARFASGGGSSALRHRETIERWLDEALEEPEQTKGRPAKKKSASLQRRAADIKSETRAVALPAPTSESVAAESASAQARGPAYVRPRFGRGGIRGESWLSAAPVTIGAALAEGGSELTAAGWLDHENSEDDMLALALSLT